MKTPLFAFSVLVLTMVVAGCDSPERSFRIAEEARTKEAFERFISDYPESDYIEKARYRLAELEFWEAVSGSVHRAHYVAYRDSFPDGLFLEEAKEGIDYAEARESDIIRSYEAFLARYPKSALADSVKRRIEQLEPVEQAFQVLRRESDMNELSTYIGEYHSTGYGKLILDRLDSVAFALGPEKAREKLEQTRIDFSKEEFLRKCEEGDLTATYMFMVAGMDPNTVVEILQPRFGLHERRHALVVASRKGHAAVVLALLKAGADPNVVSYLSTEPSLAMYETTALSEASTYGYLEIVRTLTNAGAHPEARGGGLYNAAASGYSEIVQLLLDAGADTKAALLGACGGGHVEIVRELLDAGADPNTQAEDDLGLTALFIASMRGHLDVVQSLLDAGADPNLKLRDGTTALFAPSIWGHIDIARLLLEAGANPNAKDDNGTTAIKIAAERGHSQVVDLLKEAGAE